MKPLTLLDRHLPWTLRAIRAVRVALAAAEQLRAAAAVRGREGRELARMARARRERLERVLARLTSRLCRCGAVRRCVRFVDGSGRPSARRSGSCVLCQHRAFPRVRGAA